MDAQEQMDEQLVELDDGSRLTVNQLVDRLIDFFEEISNQLTIELDPTCEGLRKILQRYNYCMKEDLNWKEFVMVAKCKGLVSKRVVKLSSHKRKKVRNKNRNRIRKEMRLYEKRKHWGEEG